MFKFSSFFYIGTKFAQSRCFVPVKRCSTNMVPNFRDIPLVRQASTKLDNLRERLFGPEVKEHSISPSNEVFSSMIVAALRKNELKTLRLIMSEAIAAHQLNCSTLDAIILDLIEANSIDKALLLVQSCDKYDESSLDGRVCNLLLDELVGQSKSSGAAVLVKYMITRNHEFDGVQLSKLLSSLMHGRSSLEELLDLLALMAKHRRGDLFGHFSSVHKKVIQYNSLFT